MLDVKDFFDQETATFTYVAIDTKTSRCAIIDSVLNYDQSSGNVSTRAADEVLAYVNNAGLHVDILLETHIHADHLTASQYLKKKTGAPIAIGSQIKSVLTHWIPVLNIAKDTAFDASQFDILLDDNATFKLGEKTVTVMHTPGHTPACVSFHIDDAVFVGDALFNPDVGCGRADFPGASAAQLYDSIQRIFSLPASTRIYTAHDYPPPERKASGLSTVSEQQEKNILIKRGTSKPDFVDVRTKRDVGKPVPKLLYPSIQVNLRGGSFGQPEDNGSRYIKIPVFHDD